MISNELLKILAFYVNLEAIAWFHTVWNLNIDAVIFINLDADDITR